MDGRAGHTFHRIDERHIAAVHVVVGERRGLVLHVVGGERIGDHGVSVPRAGVFGTFGPLTVTSSRGRTEPGRGIVMARPKEDS